MRLFADYFERDFFIHDNSRLFAGKILSALSGLIRAFWSKYFRCKDIRPNWQKRSTKLAEIGRLGPFSFDQGGGIVVANFKQPA